MNLLRSLLARLVGAEPSERRVVGERLALSIAPPSHPRRRRRRARGDLWPH